MGEPPTSIGKIAHPKLIRKSFRKRAALAARMEGFMPKARKRKSGLVALFRHYRTGKLIVARDYGHRGFPIGGKRKKR